MIALAPETTSDKRQTSSSETSKSPFARLMDLTVGWGEYVEQTETEFGDTVNSGSIYALYQSVAEFAEPYWEASQEKQEQAVREFVETRIIPVLLGKSAKAEAD